MAKPDDDEISPYLLRAPRSQHEAEQQQQQERRTRQIEGRRQLILQRAMDRLSRDELRYEASQLAAESRLCEDAEQRQLLAERAFELAQLAERAERSPTEAPVAPVSSDASANQKVDRLLERVHRWRMRAEEYRTVADALSHPRARETYLHLAHTYETLAEQYEARAHGERLLRNLRKI